jgi:hypothetical protein
MVMVTKINIEITTNVVATTTIPISNFIQENLFLTTTTINRIHLSLVMNMMKTIVQTLTSTETQQGFFYNHSLLHMFSARRPKYILIK